MATVYRYMPNGTDLTVALDKGVAGLNFAYIGGYFDYHTARDSPETISLASLQSMGQQGLGVLRVALAADQPFVADHDASYFDLPGVFVAYPASFGWAVLLAGLVLYGLSLFCALTGKGKFSDSPVSISHILRGLGLLLCLLLLGGLLIQTVYAGLQAWRGTRLLMAYSDTVFAAEMALLLGMTALVACMDRLSGKGWPVFGLCLLLGAVGQPRHLADI